MGRVIELFMWGYQPHFRSGFEGYANRVIGEIASGVEPMVLLVGVCAPGNERVHPVCVEPEDGIWDPAIFFGCKDRSESIYLTHPEHNLVYTDETAMQEKSEKIRKKAVREAVEEVVLAYDQQHFTKSFCGLPAQVDGYYVVPILQFNQSDLVGFPALREEFEIAIGFHVAKSTTGLLESVIMVLLEEAGKRLEEKNPGRSLGFEFNKKKSDLLSEAGALFCRAISYSIKDLMLQGIYEAITSISSRLYENQEIHGQLVFISNKHHHINNEVTFRKPISLYEANMARKIIEMSGQGLDCICQGEAGIRGLGEVTGEIFRIRFTGHYTWDLYFGDTLLMQVHYGVPTLPKPRLKKGDFTSLVQRIFNGGKTDPERLWQIVEGAMSQSHGTMVVVSTNADAESHRLQQQSIGVMQAELDAELVRRLSSIDGAILIDPMGVCYAVGVILDGLATEKGDPSRGARYNSALRYVTTVKHQTMCLVVSEDGFVDVVPALRPQIKKSKIHQQIQELKGKNIDTYAKVCNWLDKHRFYLTALQCETVNQEILRIESAPMDGAVIVVKTAKFEPNPEMNENYYAPEE